MPARRRQLIAAAASFSLLLAGTNALTPLLPLYRAKLGFTPVMLSLTFVIYVATMVLVLVLCARRSVIRRAPAVLALALTVSIVGDLVIALATPSAVVVGRLIAGLGNGLATGAAAALVVVVAGERGRALVATGNLVGAVLGTGAALVMVTIAPTAAPHLIFVVHAVLILVVLSFLVPALLANRNQNAIALDSDPAGRASMRPGPLVLGCLCWIAVAVPIVFLPSALAARGAALPGQVALLLILAASASAQLLARHWRLALPGLRATVFVAVGAAGELAALAVGSPALAGILALIAAPILGVGLGLGYRLGLVLLTRGYAPNSHGRLATSYAAMTYLASASAVLGVGALGAVSSLDVSAMAAFAALAVIAAAMIPGTPRLRAEA